MKIAMVTAKYNHTTSRVRRPLTFRMVVIELGVADAIAVFQSG